MTRRADLRQEREAAMEKFGLDREAFMPTKSYLALSNEDSDLLTPEQQEEAIEMAGLGAFEKAIARCIGVSENMFMQALTRGKKLESSKYHSFAKRFYEARKQHMKRNLRVMNEAIGEGDWKPAAWQLERSFGFAKQEAVEHEVAPETLSLMALAQIPVEEARAALEIEGEVVVEPDDAA